MTTLSQMISEVRANLAGYTLRQDRITNLANPGGITATDLSIQIGSAENLAKGVIEIGDELYWNGIIAGFELTVEDVIDINYEISQNV